MEQIRPNILLYHCNDTERCERYIENKEYIIESVEDGKWLGTGMYFWDNISNALYWFNEKKRKNRDGVFAIVMSQVYIDRLLDLSCQRTCDRLDDLWKVYCEKVNRRVEATLGEKINVLFKEYHDLLGEKYYILKIHGHYPRYHTKFVYYNKTDNSPQPTDKIKDVYCVRNRDCIISRKRVNNQEKII